MEEKEKVILAEDAESNLQEADKEDMDAMSEDIPDESPVEDTIEDDDEEDDDLTIKSEEFFDTTISDYDEFDEMAHKKGSGYKAPHFPIFDQKMEGLEAGLFLFAGESNMGKALRLSTPILKADGRWTTIGDIKIGDRVWGDDGTPTRVVCKSKLFHDHKCYKVTFDDNTEIYADADHLWKVYRYCCHKPNNREMVVKTSDMVKNFKHVNPDGYARYNYRVPMQKALKYEEQELPIDPYALGMWLGDGRKDGCRIICNNDEYEEEKNLLESRGIEVHEFKPDNREGHNCGSYRIGTTINQRNNILDKLRELDVLNDKHIPAIYLHSSIAQRWELLRGLMDTDGHAQTSKTGNGSCEFVQCKNSRLNESFGELLSSLGIKWTVYEKMASCNGEEFQAMRYRFACDKTHQCFNLERKCNALRDELSDRSIMYKTITDIVEVPTETMQCIEVDNVSHCFCVDKTMTVTHNTAVALELSLDYALHDKNHLFCLYFSLDDTKKEVIPRVIASHESLPISVVSKPNRYQELIDSGDSMGPDYEEMLEKRTNGLEWLKSTNHHLKIVDGTQVSCGEQMLDYCEKMKAYIQAEDPDANLIVVIDSLSDIVFASKSFKSDKELNDYVAKQVKKWAVEILDCPIFGTVHLRKIEQNRRPTIADVKESGRYAYEASALFLVHNDVSRNKQAASISVRTEGSDELIPVIELDWAKNKKSSYKGRTYQTFVTNYSQVRECSREVCERFDRLIYNV